MSSRNIKVCCGGECTINGSERVQKRLQKEFSNNQEVEISTRDCTGYCSIGPNIDVNGNIVHHGARDDMVQRVQEALVMESDQGGIPDLDIDELLEKLD